MLSVVRAGVDRDAFAVVYAEHHRRMVRLAYLLTGDPHVAEELVADAFVKVWRRWKQGDVQDVGAYLRTAVVNTARSGLRRRYLERRHAATRSGDDRGVRLLDEQAADRDAVWQGLEKLPEGQRAVIVLRFWEDLDVATTATVLGISEGTVKSQTSRAMERLGAVLEGVR